MIIEATIKKKSTLAATLKAVAGTIKDIKLQSKTVTPTEEQQVVTFDDGYDGLAAVTVEAAIMEVKLQSKTVTPTEEQQVVTFDDGYDGLAAVTVEAAELGGLTEEEAQAMVDEAIANLKLQTKTVAPTEEQQTITADEGYFGLASVIVEAAEAGGGAAPDGMNVTFGYEDGAPVAREEAYTIASANLNELGRIAQAVAGTSELMTIDEMLYHLDRAKFIPQGFASSEVYTRAFTFEANAVGELQEG